MELSFNLVGVAVTPPRQYRSDDTEPRLPLFFLDMASGRIFWNGEPGPMCDELLDQACVLWLEDGSVVAKRPYVSALGPDLYDLGSCGLRPTIAGVRISKAALMLQVMSKGEVARLEAQDWFNHNPPIPYSRRPVSR